MKAFWKIMYIFWAILLFVALCFLVTLVGACIVVVLAICAYVVAGKKGRCQEDWALGTMFFPPALLVLLCLGNENTEEVRRCPHCAEEILVKAKICKHCRGNVESIETEEKELI